MNKLLLSSILLISFGVHAGNNVAPMETSANIINTCSISATNANFGVYDPKAPIFSGLDTTHYTRNEISLKCNNKTAYIISGLAPILKYTPQGTMSIGLYLKASSSETELVYNVYAEERKGGVGAKWFSTGNPTVSGIQTYTISDIGNGDVQVKNLHFYLYGSNIYPGFWPNPDSYSGTYTLTLSY